jgi:hypothetical protein
MRLRNLLILVGVLASLVALGCWDNRQEMARVLEQGYATNAQIVAAQYQRSAPFAIDGWRPRFVEQSLSVDLQWQDKDGKAHTFRKVPVSESFEHSIVNGEQVKLMAVPVKVLDDDTSVPVITLDAAARRASLTTWLAASGYLALVGWLGVVIMTMWQRRAARLPVPSARQASRPVRIPGQRLLIGMVAFAVGAFLTYNAAALVAPPDDGVKTMEVMADIANPAGPPYTVQLGWQDGQGGVHHYGPAHVSEAFWKKIAEDGKLKVHQTKIRVHMDDTMGQPQIIDDAPGERWQTRAALGSGIALMLVGAFCLLSAARIMRRG